MAASPIIFSCVIVKEIFGDEFYNVLKARKDAEQLESEAGTHGEEQIVDQILINSNAGHLKAGKVTIPEGQFLEDDGTGHVQSTDEDGVKPTKSPRTAGRVPPTQQLTVDVGDPLSPIRNFIRRRAGLHFPKRFSKAPPPSDALGELMNDALQTKPTEEITEQRNIQHIEGRLGPKTAKFDVAAHFGSFVMTADRLGLTSQCNFGSVRANVCLFKGKWQYEVQLGSKGVMQIGFATLNTKFSQEKGVGDTSDSFGYDGNRLRKWNATTAPYGENWQTGDIIGCLIDLDEGLIEFQRNGKKLGIAFTNIHRGVGVAYFPAVSLAWGESVVANFGASPFTFPAEGYQPVQAEITEGETKIPLLFNWLNNLLRIFQSLDPLKGRQDPEPRPLTPDASETLIIVANRIFQFLVPILASLFTMEQSFLPFYATTIGLPHKVAIEDGSEILPPESHEKVHLLLDLMWTFLEEAEMKKCIERMCVVFMNCFRSNSLALSYPFQIYSLRCLIALSSHRRTRRYLLHHILFDQVKIMHFLHIRPLDDKVLKFLLPNGYWTGTTAPLDSETLDLLEMCRSIHSYIEALEGVQLEFLRTLLTNTDGNEKRPSSRSVFLRKFRAYIRDSIRPGILFQHPLNRALCAFFRVLKMTMILWNEEIQPSQDRTLPDIPYSVFFDTTIDYQDSERLGGVANFLYKTYHHEVATALKVPDYFPVTAAAVHQATPMPSLFALREFAALTAIQVPLPSNSSPTLTINLDTDNSGASHSASSVSGVAISISRRHVPEDGVIQPIITLQAPTTTPIDAISIQASGSMEDTILTLTPFSNPMPHQAYTLQPSLNSNTVRQEVLDFGGSATPQIGVIHPPPYGGLIPHSIADSNPNLLPASATSSAEDLGSTIQRMTTLIAGTPSGTNLMIPVLDLPRSAGGRLFPDGLFTIHDRIGVRPNNPAIALVSRDSGVMDPVTSLRELLDDAVMIYACGVKKHIDKIVTLRKTLEEYVLALERVKLELTQEGLTDLEVTELNRSVEVFTLKLEEQSRNLLWIQSGVFTPERQRLSFELLKVILTTLQNASSQGKLFAFVPDFYVTTMIHLTWLIISQIHPTVPYTDLPGVEIVLSDVATFVAIHFNDPRIAALDCKETLSQALSGFICDPHMLTYLERLSTPMMRRMVKALLRPYESRAWAQNNWMLLRIWQGSGFAFRYPNTIQARKSFRSQPSHDEFGVSPNLAPNPSPIMQTMVGTILVENSKLASNYIHSVLNQLNWAFSEFVGLIQEIHAGASRNERSYMEARQLKICCTCHELTQSLLRVLEMVAHVGREVFTDSNREASETLLNRLCMLLSQVLNRVGSASGTFAQVMELGVSGIENISYFPLMSAVSGVLVTLIEPELGKTEASELVATKIILKEPSFQVGSLNFLLGKSVGEVTPRILRFSLRNFVPDDVDESEVERFEAVANHLMEWSIRGSSDVESISDDDICTICYAYAKSVTFKPCNHRSCRPCIVHHLMNRGECFFCKGVIEQVIDDDGTVIHDINQDGSHDSDSEMTIESMEQFN